MEGAQLAAAVLPWPCDTYPAFLTQFPAELRVNPGAPAIRRRDKASIANLLLKKGTYLLAKLINAFNDLRSGKIKSDTFHTEHSCKSLVLIAVQYQEELKLILLKLIDYHFPNFRFQDFINR